MRTLGCTLLILIFAASSWSQVLFAPEMLVLDVEAGATIRAEVVVKNESDKVKEFKMAIEYRRPGPCKLKVEKWVLLEPEQLRLKKGESGKVRLELKGQAKQARGECVLALFAGEKKPGRITLEVGIGMPIFVRLNNETRVQGRIKDLEQNFLPGGLFQLAIAIKNTGSLHLTPYGIAWVEDSAGESIWQIELRPDKPVFPGQTYELLWQGKGPDPGGKGKSLGVRLFWGTLYGVDKVGAPESEEIKVSIISQRP